MISGNEGLRCAVVNLDPVPHHLGRLVAAPDQRLVTTVAESFPGRRMAGNVIHRRATRADEPSGQTLNDEVGGKLDGQDEIHLPSGFCQEPVECVGLRHGAWKAVENKTGPSIGLGQPLSYQRDGQLIGDVRSGIQVGADLRRE